MAKLKEVRALKSSGVEPGARCGAWHAVVADNLRGRPGGMPWLTSRHAAGPDQAREPFQRSAAREQSDADLGVAE
jgi:hypothetical protein